MSEAMSANLTAAASGARRAGQGVGSGASAAMGRTGDQVRAAALRGVNVSQTSKKPLLRALSGEVGARRPLWMMRQAGRYLPEYRELRATAPSFMDFCFDPAKAAEATLQPIRRFGFDAAIIFSDILVIPEALGQKVSFEAGEGPRLRPTESPKDLDLLSAELDVAILAPVYEALERVKAALDESTALIGFCGAPWTIASYMIAGRGTPDQAPARRFAYQHPEAFQRLIDLITRACVEHLSLQVKAGAEVVQIFDSWASVLPAPQFERWCLEPVRAIAAHMRARHPETKVIAFPRGVSPSHVGAVARLPGVNGVGLDTSADLADCLAHTPGDVTLQGNLDPLLLLAGGPELVREIARIKAALGGRPHIFNLGHGILPPTPIEHVETLIREVRAG